MCFITILICCEAWIPGLLEPELGDLDSPPEAGPPSAENQDHPLFSLLDSAERAGQDLSDRYNLTPIVYHPEAKCVILSEVEVRQMKHYKKNSFKNLDDIF